MGKVGKDVPFRGSRSKRSNLRRQASSKRPVPKKQNRHSGPPRLQAERCFPDLVNLWRADQKDRGCRTRTARACESRPGPSRTTSLAEERRRRQSAPAPTFLQDRSVEINASSLAAGTSVAAPAKRPKGSHGLNPEAPGGLTASWPGFATSDKQLTSDNKSLRDGFSSGASQSLTFRPPVVSPLRSPP